MFDSSSEYQNTSTALNSPPYDNQPFSNQIDPFSLSQNSNLALSSDDQFQELEFSSAVN